jgi:hypothetical protein
MSIQQTAAILEDRIRNSPGDEAIVPKVELIRFIEQGEQQLKGLYDRIKDDQREIAVLKDRVEAQRDTIERLESAPSTSSKR